MGEKIKKLLRMFFSNKKVLFLTLELILFLSLIPLHSAHANIFSDILNGIKNIPIWLPVLIIVVPLYVVTAALGLFVTILNQLMLVFVRATMSIGVTPVNQPIVQVGWEVSQSLVNILFILILVFIGLATILRLQTYQAQKTLPLLIIIALLVNFSGVLVGFIVDISNLVTNFFLSASLGFGALGQQLLAIGTQILDVITAPGATIFTEAAALVLQIVVQLIYFLLSIFITFTIMLLFLARVIALWILAILAPIAFASYVLPATRKWWTQWWQQLIQWSIIGIPIAFFLYISSNLLAKLQDVSQNPFRQGPNNIGQALEGAFTTFPNLAAIIVSILGNFVVLTMLMVGVMLSMQMAPSGAQGVINFGKSVPGRITKTRIGARALGGLAAGTQKGLAGVAPFMRRMEERAGKVPGIGKALKPTTAIFARPTGWMARGVGRMAGPALLEYAAKTRRVPEADLKKIDGMSGTETESYVKQKAILGNDKLQYQARMAEKGTLDFTSQEFQNDAAKNAGSIIDNHDPYYQKEAEAIAKNIPDKVFANNPEAKEPKDRNKGDERYVHMKTLGKTGSALAEAEKEAREELKKTKEEIKRRISNDDATIEVGLKLKYITKDEVDKNRAVALAKAKISVTAGEITKFLDDAVATAATATYVKEFKPEDVKKLANPDTLGAKIGLTLGNPRNIQKIQDSFGQKKFKGVIEGVGGLNSATNTPDKLEEFAKNVNPGLTQAMFTSPAYREVDLEARNNMVDEDGKPTDNYNDLKRKIEIHKIFATNSNLETLYNNVRPFEKQAEEDKQKITEALLRLKDAKTRKSAAEAAILQANIDSWEAHADSVRVAALNEIENASPSLKMDWKNKIEPLRGKK